MSKTIINQTQRSPIDGTEWYVLATAGANWKAQGGTQNFIFNGVFGGNAAGSSLTLGSTTGTGTSDSIIFQTASQTTAMTIDTNQRVNISTHANIFNSTLELHGISAAGASISFARFSADTGAPKFILVKSRGATIGTNSAAQSGDGCGLIDFQGADGANYQEVAFIGAVADGANVSSTSSPGRLTLQTTASGSTAAREVGRFDATGNFTVFVGEILSNQTPGNNATFDTSGQTTVSVTNGSNAQICSTHNGMMILISNDTGSGVGNSHSAIYFASSGSVNLVTNIGSTWIAPTTTPGAGLQSVAFNVGNSTYNVYNNIGSTQNYRVMSFRTGA